MFCVKSTLKLPRPPQRYAVVEWLESWSAVPGDSRSIPAPARSFAACELTACMQGHVFAPYTPSTSCHPLYTSKDMQ